MPLSKNTETLSCLYKPSISSESKLLVSLLLCLPLTVLACYSSLLLQLRHVSRTGLLLISECGINFSCTLCARNVTLPWPPHRQNASTAYAVSCRNHHFIQQLKRSPTLIMSYRKLFVSILQQWNKSVS